MNVRSIAVIGLVAVMGIGLLMLLRDLLTPAAPPRRVQVAVAAQQIQPYTVITQDMVRASDFMNEGVAQDSGMWPIDAVVGLMSTALIAPGSNITGVNAKPIEKVRFTEDLGLEIMTFAAAVDRAVGGQLRPGHIVNLYGNGRDEDGNAFTVLVEPQLWVVAVSAGGRPVSNVTPQPDVRTGEYAEIGGGQADQPASMITVAVPPDKAFRIVDALGAQRLEAYVTLAASQTASMALATPVGPPATATPGMDPGLAQTATALWNALQRTPQPPVVPRAGDGGAHR